MLNKFVYLQDKSKQEVIIDAKPSRGEGKKKKISFSQSLVANQNLIKRKIKVKKKTKLKKRLNIGFMARKDTIPISAV